MDFSEFRRLLGADPRNRDPAFLRARTSSAEFEAAAAGAERFEALLDRAVSVPVPGELMADIRSIPRGRTTPAFRRPPWRLAMAAGLLVAIGAASLVWQSHSSWDSVEDYVADHYRHDGLELLAMSDGQTEQQVQTLLAEFDMQALPELAGIVGVIKFCPTPDGRGVHMVLNSERGPVTVIYMPGTPVTDREWIAFDDREALLVALKSGSAAIIGSPQQQIAQFYALVQDSIVPVPDTT